MGELNQISLEGTDQVLLEERRRKLMQSLDSMNILANAPKLFDAVYRVVSKDYSRWRADLMMAMGVGMEL